MTSDFKRFRLLDLAVDSPETDLLQPLDLDGFLARDARPSSIVDLGLRKPAPHVLA